MISRKWYVLKVQARSGRVRSREGGGFSRAPLLLYTSLCVKQTLHDKLNPPLRLCITPAHDYSHFVFFVLISWMKGCIPSILWWSMIKVWLRFTVCVVRFVFGGGRYSVIEVAYVRMAGGEGGGVNAYVFYEWPLGTSIKKID